MPTIAEFITSISISIIIQRMRHVSRDIAFGPPDTGSKQGRNSELLHRGCGCANSDQCVAFLFLFGKNGVTLSSLTHPNRESPVLCRNGHYV